MRIRHTGVLAACLLLTWITLIAGCQKAERLQQPEFPLSEEAVTEALKELGLEWRIERVQEDALLDEETTPTVNYSLCTSDDSAGYPTVFINSYHSTAFGRFLQATLYMNKAKVSEIRESGEISWEDWREVIELSAQLYGGFESADEIYQACTAAEIPEDEKMLWQGSLTGGYCTIEAMPGIQTWSKKGGSLHVIIYESEDAFQRMQQRAQEIVTSFQ